MTDLIAFWTAQFYSKPWASISNNLKKIFNLFFNVSPKRGPQWKQKFSEQNLWFSLGALVRFPTPGQTEFNKISPARSVFLLNCNEEQQRPQQQNNLDRSLTIYGNNYSEQKSENKFLNNILPQSGDQRVYGSQTISVCS